MSCCDLAPLAIDSLTAAVSRRLASSGIVVNSLLVIGSSNGVRAGSKGRKSAPLSADGTGDVPDGEAVGTGISVGDDGAPTGSETPAFCEILRISPVSPLAKSCGDVEVGGMDSSWYTSDGDAGADRLASFGNFPASRCFSKK